MSGCNADGLLGQITVDKIINPDEEPPIISFSTVPSALTGDQTTTITYTVIDDPKGQGIREAIWYYTPDLDNPDWKQMGTLVPGENRTIEFCVPNKTHPKPGFKITAVDLNGNEAEKSLGELPTFSITPSSAGDLSSFLPTITSDSNGLTNNATTSFSVNSCPKTNCSASSIKFEPPSWDIYFAINVDSGSAPASGDAAWVSCQDAIDLGLTLPDLEAITPGDGDKTISIWVKTVDTDFDGITPLENISTSSNDVTVTFDTTPPSETGLTVLGSTYVRKARGQYLISDCTDVAKVLVTDNLESAPTAGDTRWQDCSDSLYSITYDNMKVGTNGLRFWLKDAAENVNTTQPLTYSTDYASPNITVVDGPTVNTSVAQLTIDICEEVGMTHVLFNLTGTQPTASDANWQTCSKAVGALSSPLLSPGNNTLKAFYKYDDNFISVYPIDVAVTYSPSLSWDNTPVSNRPNMTFTGYNCNGIKEVFFNQNSSTPPTAITPGWQTCSINAGAYSYTLESGNVGTQAVYAFFKADDDSIYSDYDTITVNYDPPTATRFGGVNVTTTRPALSVDDCNGIDKVYVKLNDASIISPTVGDFDTNGFNCTTALNGIELNNFPSPAPLTLPSEGDHFYDVYFRFSADNYILPHNLTRHRINVTYLAPDTTPPDVTGFTGADVNPALTFENEVSPNTSPKTIDANGSRAYFTVNTCNPKTPVALTGTVTATNGSDTASTSADLTSEIATGDFIEINGGNYKVKTVSATDIVLVSNFTGTTGGYSTNKVYPEDAFAKMYITSVSEGAGAPSAPAANNADWVTCSTVAQALKTKTFSASGNYDLYVFFQDAAGNVSATVPEAQFEGGDRTITVDLAALPVAENDVPRPNVFLKDAPTVTTPPAQFRVEDCTGLDQVYLEVSRYPNYAPKVDGGISGWQDCSTVFDVNNITYDVDLRGSYTISVWFKEPGGVVNPTPRDIAFIFDPTQGAFNNPLALWTLDNTSRKRNRFVDGKGDNHLYIWNPTNITSETAKVDEGVDVSGTNSYLFTQNAATLKPPISVTLSLWAYITNGDAGTKGLAGAIEDGTGGYGLRLQGGQLRFYASGRYQNGGATQSAAVATSSITTGWHHIIGSSDGRYIDLYVDGQQVGDKVDLGSPANLTYGCNKLFVVGGSADCSDNPKTTELFDGKLDEIVVFPQYFTAQNALDHYIDTFNNFHANQDNVAPADVTTTTFFGDFLQNVLLTTPSCGDAKYIYVDETTHPPLVDTDRWQLCSEVVGATIQANKSQGAHELKIWAKDEYDNISAGYLKVDTVVEGILYKEPPILYYSLDSNRISGSTIYEPYSLMHATNNGAASNSSGLQNDSMIFVRSESDFIERKYAFNAQPTEKISFSVWAKLTQNDNVAQVIAGTRDPANNHGYSIEIESNELRFFVETSGGSRQVGVGTGTYSTEWHNIIGTYDGRIQRLYIDATKVAETDHISPLNIQYTGLGNFVIGAGATRNIGARVGTHFNNEIDEVFLWDSALTQATINGFFYGQDTIPPLAVAVNPEAFTVGIPVAKFDVTNCNDIGSVYLTLESTQPISDIDGWQTCSESGFTIRSPLLANGTNTVKVWFKDASGNVSNTSTDVDITFTYDFTIPNPNAYWTLDATNIDGSTVYDVVGTKHGASYGTLPNTGKVEEALQFNGTDEWVEVPYSADFQPTNEVTISAWFNSDSLPSADQVIAGNYNGGGYALVLTNGYLEFRVEANGTTQVAQYDTTPLSAGTWYHVAGVWDDGTIRLFVNGVEEVNTVLFANMPIDYANNNSFLIGAASTTTTGAAGSYFDGGLDEVAFFQSALTDTVIAEMYDRGNNNDKIFYDVNPPTIPVTATLLYYNSLVSRANLTFTDCTGVNYVIVTKDVFPPDKNDEDWQPCNTTVGGILTKELRTTDSFGKLWTKDTFGNVSKEFEYVPVTTKYDLPIQRPIVHWTFDADHYSGQQAFDRIGNINLNKVHLYENDPTCLGISYAFDGTGSGLTTPGPDAVLNKGYATSHHFNTVGCNTTSNVDGGTPTQLRFLRALHPENSKVKPTDKISVAAWVKLTGSGTHPNQHLISTELNNKGWAIRLDASSPNDFGLRWTVWTAAGKVEPYLETREYSTGWHLIHGVYDGTNAKLYFDGILVKSFPNPSGSPSPIVYEPNAKLMIGAKQTAGDFPEYNNPISIACSYGSCSRTVSTDSRIFQGEIDEILIWDKASTGLEASSLYHNGADILYVSDTTPPTNPSLTLENTKPDMFSDKAYFSVDTCYRSTEPSPKPVEDQIVGVLVNEGTQPDKQDSRWQVCRTRLGNFGLEDLTPGGHTITTWFKDRAGNVTPASSDLVVNYIQDAIPQANAFWPLDLSSRVGNYQRNIIETDVHDLLLVNVDTPLVPGTAQTNDVGKVQESMQLYTNGTTGSFMSAKTTNLLRPVNYFTVGGWFWIDNTWNSGVRYLVDHNTGTRSGYLLRTNGANLEFMTDLDIETRETLSYALGSMTTGWNHILGRFDGYNLHLIVNGTAVASRGPFLERDFVVYDNKTDFRIGANSENYSNVTNYFAERVDEVGIWGFDLPDADITNLITANNAGNHSYPALTVPAAMDNAFIYHYDNEGNRARMTILDCTNTPYVFVKEESADPVNPVAPDPESLDWVKCRTQPGAVLSKELPNGTTYVEVWTKNADGVMASSPGVREIDPITEDYSLAQPITYFSLDDNMRNGTTHYDHYSETTATAVNLGYSTNENGGGSTFNDNDSRLSPADSLHYDLRTGLSINTWASFTNGDTNTEVLFRRTYFDDSNYEFGVYLSGGNLVFRINVAQPNGLARGTSYPTVYYPTSKISTGRHMVTAQYDGQKMMLWIDGMKVRELDVGYRSWASTANRNLTFSRISQWRMGMTSDSWGEEIDEFRVFAKILSEAEIDKLHQAYVDDFNTGNDTTAPTTVPNISVMEYTFGGGKWSSETNDPRYKLDSCGTGTGDDLIYGVYVTIGATPAPSKDTAGWQKCDTDDGYFTGPTLASGDNTVKFWYKDQYGNVTSASQDIIVNYTSVALHDPVAYWPLDDNSIVVDQAYDLINGNNAYIYYTNVVAGKSGTAMQFDGTRKYIEVEHNSAIKPTEEITLSAWVNIPASSTDRTGDYVLDTTGTNPGGYFWRWACTGTCTGSGSDPANNEYFEFGLTLNGSLVILDFPQGQIGTGWKHIITTFDGRTLKLYVDKVLRRTLDLNNERTITYAAENVSLIMGAKATDTEKPSGNYFHGQLDEVAIYNRALLQAQVDDLYDNYANAGARIYNRGVAAATPVNTNVTRWVPAGRAYGNRYRFTVSNCGTNEMILINDNSVTPPAANSADWQPCNTNAGGILSAALADTGAPVAFAVWGRTFDGSSVTAAAGNANSETYSETFDGSVPPSRVHWSLDSGAITGTEIYDLASTSHGTRPTLANPTNEAAVIDNGFTFSGLEYLTIKPTPATNPFYKISISAWAELTRGDTYHRHIVGNHQNLASQTGNGSGLRVYNGRLEFYVTARNNTGSAAFYTVGIDSNLYSTGFHHVVGTYDGRTLILFLDGVEVKRYNIPFYGADVYQVLNDDYSHWTIGAETEGKDTARAASFFIGKIDDIRIWDQTLSPIEVYRLYDYGSYFLPSTDGTLDPPNDPGIYLSSGITTTTSPWAVFTMPTCTAPNGEQIDSIYVNTSADPAPTNTDLGWQYCSTDDGYIQSSILGRGTTTVNVYFRDEEGEISSATSFNVTYVEPTMPLPATYYTFDSDNSSGSSTTYDQAGYVIARRTPHGATIALSPQGITENGFIYEYATFTRTSIREMWSPTKEYTASFWYKNPVAMTDTVLLYQSPMVTINRTSSDNIQVINKTFPNFNFTSTERLSPNTWTHIAVSRLGNSIKLYFNGRPVESYNVALNANPQALFLNMGSPEVTDPQVMDEVVTYNRGLSEDQIAFLYFAGANNENLLTEKLNLSDISVPDHYYTFDDADISGSILSDKVGSMDLTIREAITTGETTNIRHGESFNFSRFEETIGTGGNPSEADGPNSNASPKQYLESDGATPVALGTEFAMAAWFKRKVDYEWSDDRTAIIDQWGPEVANQSFRLYYNRGGDGTFVGEIKLNGISYSVNSAWDSRISSTAWTHVLFVRNGAWLTMYINGVLSGQTYIAVAHQGLSVDTPTGPIRLRIGESSLWPQYVMPGTVSISTGSNAVTGTGTDFLNELLETKTGTVDVTAGTAIVTGTGTLFNIEINVGDRIRIGSEFHVVLSKSSNTDLVLQTPHTAGATGSSIELVKRGRVYINGEERFVETVTSSTSFTTTIGFNTTFSGEWKRNIAANNTVGSDEWGMNAYLDEVGIWKDKAVSYGEATKFYNFNLTAPITLEPLVSMVGFGGNTSKTTRADLDLSDCANYTHVWVGFDGDTDPTDASTGDATYDGWVACNEAASGHRSPLLNAGTNNLKLWFKTGTVVSAYTTTITIEQNTGDVVPPTVPTVTLNNGPTTTDSFARFTINSCVTNEVITGVIVQHDGTDPTADDSRWTNCTTTVNGFLSPPLNSGANTISFYFKDAAGNVTAKDNHAITYNQPVITTPTQHLTFGDGTYANGFLKETVERKYLKAYNTGNMTYPSTGRAGEGIDFSSTAYFEGYNSSVSLTNAVTVSAWVNLSVPSTTAHIIGQWDESQAESQWAMRVDQTGRLCFDFQTVNSTGVWNSDSYKRSCSTSRVPFAEWAHVAVVRNGSSLDFYINNKAGGSDTIDAGNFSATTLAYRVGAQERGTSDPTNGVLDEVSIWTSALDATQREAAYAEGLREKSIYGDRLPQAVSIAPIHWNFDDANWSDPTLSAAQGAIDLEDIPSLTPSSVTPGQTGQVAQSFAFSNENQLRANSDSLNLGTTFTISTWFKVNSADGGEIENILNKWDAGDTNLQEFRLYAEGTTLKFDYNTTTVDTFPDVGYNTLTAEGTLTLGQWHHAVVTRNGSELSIFIDGTFRGRAVIGTDPLEDIARPLRVGSDSTASNALNGEVDETAFYLESYDPNEIETLYELGNGGTTLPVNITISVAEESTTVVGSTVKLTIGDCNGNSNYIVTNSATPPAAGAVTGTCTEAIGGASYTGLTSGSNTLYLYYGNGSSTVFSGPSFTVTRSD